MAELTIAEYELVANDLYGRIVPVPIEPAVARQTVAIGASSAASNAFNARTKFVLLTTDTACLIAFGTAPDADDYTAYLAAGQAMFFGVSPDLSLKVAVKAVPE